MVSRSKLFNDQQQTKLSREKRGSLSHLNNSRWHENEIKRSEQKTKTSISDDPFFPFPPRSLHRNAASSHRRVSLCLLFRINKSPVRRESERERAKFQQIMLMRDDGAS